MEELAYQEKPGFFSRMKGLFVHQDEPEEERFETATSPTISLKTAYRYTVTIRRGIKEFDDAIAAASGLRRGEQQILNLAGTDPLLRQKIVDFMSGVNFAQDGTWEEIGENIYLIVPANAYVEVAPGAYRGSSRN
jgi:cell division inhibitor SepF